MKAVVFDADWAPKRGYEPTDEERKTRFVKTGSQVWKNPRLTISDLPIPELAPNEVLIRVKAAGICGSDQHVYESGEDGYTLYPGPVAAPVVLGHEFSGLVEKVGSAVTDFVVGDMLVSEEYRPCGECYPCRLGHPMMCRNMHADLGFRTNGGMAEYTVASSSQLWKINSFMEAYDGDEDRAFEAGAMVEPASIAFNALFVEGGGFTPGAYVAVFGTGPIGLCAIALSRAAGAAKVIAFEMNVTRAQLAHEFGVDAVHDPADLATRGTSPADVMLELTNGDGVNVIFEAAGAPHITLSDATRALGIDGKILVVGLPTKPAPLDLGHFLVTGSQLIGSGGHLGHGTFGNVIRLLASKRIDLSAAITARFALTNALDAFHRLESREDAKVMLRM
ncbi:MAG: alcohol dehydrogenase catalytic domain-containing protein [Actinobacteria bacterium]|nr:alcohol dehydrogenase catalytic domain-containing protein [Actinomycetota bacterium]